MGRPSEFLTTAKRAAVDAGKYILDRMGKIEEVTYKDGPNNFVTDVDKASEKIIIDTIRQVFPGHSILAEESGEQQSDDEIKWVIDPIDGTVNYAHSFPFFCVSIGVMRNGAVEVGVVYEPVRGELFSAVKGSGALLNGEEIKVSEVSSVRDALVGTGFAYSVEGRLSNMQLFGKMSGKAQGLRRAGAAALDLCYVACGRMDGFWEMNLSPWDTAAGHLMVSEAGGKVSTLDGREYDIYSRDILATNGSVHSELADILNGQ